MVQSARTGVIPHIATLGSALTSSCAVVAHKEGLTGGCVWAGSATVAISLLFISTTVIRVIIQQY